jgi:hypothetical protein
VKPRTLEPGVSEWLHTLSGRGWGSGTLALTSSLKPRQVVSCSLGSSVVPRNHPGPCSLPPPSCYWELSATNLSATVLLAANLPSEHSQTQWAITNERRCELAVTSVAGDQSRIFYANIYKDLEPVLAACLGYGAATRLSFRLVQEKFVPYEFDFSDADSPHQVDQVFLSELSSLL